MLDQKSHMRKHATEILDNEILNDETNSLHNYLIFFLFPSSWSDKKYRDKDRK